MHYKSSVYDITIRIQAILHSFRLLAARTTIPRRPGSFLRGRLSQVESALSNTRERKKVETAA